MTKALRLPIILVALMLMGGIISWLRPPTKIEAPTRSSVLEVEAFEPGRANSLVKINGLSEADYAAQVQTQNQQDLLGFQKPSLWTSADIRSIESRAGKTVLVFTDGSTREVTPALYQQLPGDLQTKVGYNREQ